MEQVSARVPDGTQERLDALIPEVAKMPNVGDVVMSVNRAHVMRLVIERGLASLEADVTAASDKTPRKS